MDALRCDICGGSLTMDISGEFAICDSCGMKYSKEHVKAKVQEIKGTVSVEGPVKVQSTDFEIQAGVLLKYHGEATDVVIPNSVTIIGVGAFSNCKGLTSVTIPDSVTIIDGSAFVDCTSLASVTIPNSVTCIGGYAFAHCNGLTSITIPGSVTHIGNNAFAYCSSLAEVTILGDALTFDYQEEISDDPFWGCPASMTIHASEEWKREHWNCTEYLKSYKPAPPPSSGSSSTEGCYIATAVYGSYDCPQVWTLRRYRDNRLAKHLLGRAFIHCYYAISPHLVRWFGKTKRFQSFWRWRLDNLVLRLKDTGVADTPYCDRKW